MLRLESGGPWNYAGSPILVWNKRFFQVTDTRPRRKWIPITTFLWHNTSPFTQKTTHIVSCRNYGHTSYITSIFSLFTSSNGTDKDNARMLGRVMTGSTPQSQILTCIPSLQTAVEDWITDLSQTFSLVPRSCCWNIDATRYRISLLIFRHNDPLKTLQFFESDASDWTLKLIRLKYFRIQSVKQSKAGPLPPWKRYGESYSSYSFLTSALHGMSGQRHAPAALYPRERTPVTYWVEGWVGFTAGLDTEAREWALCLCRG
jgi:hypothetical protein